MESDVSYYRHWGKAVEGDYHLLPYHSLDVAAVGQCLLDTHSGLRKRLAALLGIDQADFSRWAVYMLSLHDIGKFSVSFQNLRPDLLDQLQSRRTETNSGLRHDTLGYLAWQYFIAGLLGELGLLTTGRGAQVFNNSKIWAAAVTGHHGKPPEPRDIVLGRYFKPLDRQAIRDYVAAVSELLLENGPRFPEVNELRMRHASWWLAGFTVLCDWLGSNRDYFTYRQEIVPLEEYWEEALGRARAAIDATELLPAAVADVIRLEQLIDSEHTLNPTPLQDFSARIELGAGPQLFILEDVTGAGKTEAALLLAHRLMASGQAQGVYFGLPTMATANSMYERVAGAYKGFYHAESRPSLVLAHSASRLSDTFRQSIVPVAKQGDGECDGGPAAAAHCAQWLADNRKKALLAEMGIGTVDQALLAILPSRHQSLRLLGMLNKVLLVDEVHACDAYMHALLCGLLRAHASAGGSAILLSATLPRWQRQALADSFSDGLGVVRQDVVKRDYPLLSQFGAGVLYEQPLSSRESVCREVKVRCVESEAAVEIEIDRALAAGGCVCWIRNTVGDAIDAYECMHAAHPEWVIELFHARFALGDRLDIENRVLGHFGKDSTGEQRAGRLLIATQVVEQSLDLDFDYLVSDLAPIDLIIQRAGRLRRHRRAPSGDRLAGDQPDQRGPAELVLLTPPWSDQPNADWFATAFKRAQAVYPDHGRLWLGLDLLRRRGGFRMPDDARMLIEGVYGADVDIPEGLSEKSIDAEGEAKAKQSVAMLNELKIDLGYDDQHVNRWWDESQTPTRLGEPTTTVWLARWENGELKPWRDDPAFPWYQSSLNLRSALIEEAVYPEDLPQDLVDACRQDLPAKGRWGVLLPLVKGVDGGWESTALTQSGAVLRLFYWCKTGLVYC